MCGEEAGVHKHPRAHEGRTDEHRLSATPSISPEQSGDGHEDIDDVLNGGSKQVGVASVAGHGKDVGNVVHHDIHTAELGPDLGEETDDGTVEHLGLEKVEVGDVGVAALKFAHVLDILKLVRDKRVVGVALAVNEGENSVAILPAVFAGEPARGLGERHHHEEEEDGGDHLQGPWDTPVGGAVVVPLVLANLGTAVGDVVHDENTPGNGPLLETNEATALGGRRDLGNVDWDLGGFDTDRDTVDDTGKDEHALVLCGGAENGADDP